MRKNDACALCDAVSTPRLCLPVSLPHAAWSWRAVVDERTRDACVRGPRSTITRDGTDLAAVSQRMAVNKTATQWKAVPQRGACQAGCCKQSTNSMVSAAPFNARSHQAYLWMMREGVRRDR